MSHEVLHGVPVRAAATPAAGRGASGLHKGTVDVAKRSRLHALSALCAASWNNRAVDSIVSLVEPFVCSFAARPR